MRCKLLLAAALAAALAVASQVAAAPPVAAAAINVSDAAQHRIRYAVKWSRTGDLLFYDYDHDGVVSHVELVYRKGGTGPRIAVSASHSGGPPVNFHRIRYQGLVTVGRVVR
jgi:opacity protein-like surface antigen